MGTNAPKRARWASWLISAMGAVLAVATLLIVTLPDASPQARVVGALAGASIAGGLLLLGWQLRLRNVWAHRIAIALVALQLVATVVRAIVAGRFDLPWFPVLLLWLLLNGQTRRWFAGEPEPPLGRALDEPSLDEINRRFAERPITRD